MSGVMVIGTALLFSEKLVKTPETQKGDPAGRLTEPAYKGAGGAPSIEAHAAVRLTFRKHGVTQRSMPSRDLHQTRPQAALPLRIGSALLAGVAVLGIAQAIIRNAQVNSWIEAGEPPAQASNMPVSAEAGLNLAEQRATAQDWQGAAEHARDALARSPISVRAARMLGLAAEAGKTPQAGEWMGLGGQLGWRDTPMQLWLIEKAAEYGDLNNLVIRADGLLRRNQAHETVLPLLRNAASVAGGAQLIAERLAAEPGWRKTYFTSFKDFTADQMSGHEAVLVALRTTDVPPTRAEVGPYLRKLVELGEPLRARAFWSRMGGQRLSPGSPISDSSFTAAREYPPEEVIPFEWKLQNGAGAGSASEKINGNAVLIAQTDGSALSPVASQLLVLGPGRWRFTATVASAATSHDRIGFAWGLKCSPGNKPIYPELAPSLSGSGEARSISFAFVVPADCPAQLLELRSSRLSPPMSTEARFDDIRLVWGG